MLDLSCALGFTMRTSLVLFCLFLPVFCYIGVPGILPVEYKNGDKISVRAIKVWSNKMQMPIDFYDYLSFCELEGRRVYEPLNIGEVLRGDRVAEAPFEINMLTNVQCKNACKVKFTSAKSVDALIDFVSNEYIVNIEVDGLPVVTKLSSEYQIPYELGYRIGSKFENMVYLNNHIKFLVKYHEVNGLYQIVGVNVEPKSVQNTDIIQFPNKSCEISTVGRAPLYLKTGFPMEFTFTYGVEWEKSELDWASREEIFNTHDGQIHWFSIINSVIIIIFLAAVVAAILLKTLRRDIAAYNREEGLEEITEESGWKLVHGDVFRPPRYSSLLAAFVGTGVQLLCMTFIVLFFAMLGMLSPASRGALLSAVIFTYVFMGAVAGYFSGRLYKTMRGFYWKSTALLTGTLCPGIILAVCLFINIFLWAKGSSAALPFTTILGILSLWLLISLPLVFMGFFFGVRKRPFELPVRTNQIPRAIPDRKMHQNVFVTTMLFGLLPFGSIFIEVFFVFNALWNRQIYYLFGFLFIVFIILIISCAQVTIVMTYLQLCSEDYHWWWRSFITSGGAAIYLFLYSIYYFTTRLEITSFVPTLLYFGYCSILTAIFWILTGTIGFFSSLIFLRKIYGAVKVD